MRNLQIMIIISCIALSSCIKRPRKPLARPTNEPYFPVELRSGGQTVLPNLVVPNEKFCSEMKLQPAQHYMVMPWWYNYCDKLYENREKKSQNNVYNLPLYRNVLDQLRAYKKMQKLKEYQYQK